MTPADVDWSDPAAKVSCHFSVHEATWLPSWSIHHLPSDEEKANIVAFAARLDMVRDHIGHGMRVHVWIRPEALNNPASPHHGENYNRLVGGAPKSAHRLGRGCDWDDGTDCDARRADLEPLLGSLNLRMEDKPMSGWVHLDDMPVINARYFVP